MDCDEVLRVRGLNISFRQYDRGFDQVQLDVIRDLSVTVHSGEVVAVVGASGSGKSLLVHGILGVLPYNAQVSGDLFFRGERLTAEYQKRLRGSEIAFVPQSVSYLDPLMKVGPQISGANGVGGFGKKRKEKARDGAQDGAPKGARDRVKEVLARYGLRQEVAGQYPFQLSGGMTRRVLISTAMVQKPRLILADEPTPGLHMDAARRVLGHFREFADEGCGVLLITHDLELAMETADRVVVLYAGTAVEDAAASDFQQLGTLRHPYSRALWQAMPRNGFLPTAGTQPFVKELPSGCPFGPRCSRWTEACQGEIPWRSLRGGHVRCVAERVETEGL